MSKKLRTDEITEMLLDEILDSDAENVESDFSSGSDDNYDPESGLQDEESSSSSSSKSELSEVESTVSMDELEEPHQQQGRLWSSPEGNFVPKHFVSDYRECNINPGIPRTSSAIEIFHKLFPRSLEFPALGTCMRNRKNLPVLDEKLKRSESSFRVSTSGLLCVKWQDTKEVMVLSNCHTSTMTTVNKTLKDGKKISVSCPESIKFYREAMGGVDRADQMAGIYEYDRKSTKWWKKVFYRLLMFSAVNSWIIYCDLRREKLPSIEFLITLTESLIAEGKKTAAVRRSQ